VVSKPKISALPAIISLQMDKKDKASKIFVHGAVTSLPASTGSLSSIMAASSTVNTVENNQIAPTLSTVIASDNVPSNNNIVDTNQGALDNSPSCNNKETPIDSINQEVVSPIITPPATSTSDTTPIMTASDITEPSSPSPYIKASSHNKETSTDNTTTTEMITLFNEFDSTDQKQWITLMGQSLNMKSLLAELFAAFTNSLTKVQENSDSMKTDIDKVADDVSNLKRQFSELKFTRKLPGLGEKAPILIDVNSFSNDTQEYSIGNIRYRGGILEQKFHGTGTLSIPLSNKTLNIAGTFVDGYLSLSQQLKFSSGDATAIFNYNPKNDASIKLDEDTLKSFTNVVVYKDQSKASEFIINAPHYIWQFSLKGCYLGYINSSSEPNGLGLKIDANGEVYNGNFEDGDFVDQ
jgi:hypothetical protein